MEDEVEDHGGEWVSMFPAEGQQQEDKAAEDSTTTMVNGQSKAFGAMDGLLAVMQRAREIAHGVVREPFNANMGEGLDKDSFAQVPDGDSLMSTGDIGLGHNHATSTNEKSFADENAFQRPKNGILSESLLQATPQDRVIAYVKGRVFRGNDILEQAKIDTRAGEINGKINTQLIMDSRSSIRGPSLSGETNGTQPVPDMNAMDNMPVDKEVNDVSNGIAPLEPKERRPSAAVQKHQASNQDVSKDQTRDQSNKVLDQKATSNIIDLTMDDDEQEKDLVQPQSQSQPQQTPTTLKEQHQHSPFQNSLAHSNLAVNGAQTGASSNSTTHNSLGASSGDVVLLPQSATRTSTNGPQPLPHAHPSPQFQHPVSSSQNPHYRDTTTRGTFGILTTNQQAPQNITKLRSTYQNLAPASAPTFPPVGNPNYQSQSPRDQTFNFPGFAYPPGGHFPAYSNSPYWQPQQYPGQGQPAQYQANQFPLTQPSHVPPVPPYNQFGPPNWYTGQNYPANSPQGQYLPRGPIPLATAPPALQPLYPAAPLPRHPNYSIRWTPGPFSPKPIQKQQSPQSATSPNFASSVLSSLGPAGASLLPSYTSDSTPSKRAPLVHSISQTLQQQSTFKTQYDPKTIVEDLQLALGVHPERPGLNYQLEPLKRLHPEVDNDSDLGTFRWDLAYPNGLPVEGLAEAAKKMQPPLSKTPIQASSFYSSPNAPRTGPRPNIDPTPRRPSNLRHESTLGSGSGIAVVIPSPAKSLKDHTNAKDASRASSVTDSSPSASPRRGRPPKSSHTTPSKHKITPTKRPRTHSESSDPLSQDTPNRSHLSEVTPKRRGRPPREPNTIVKSTPEPGVPKKRGRPFKYKPPDEIPRQEPRYYPFKCEWKGCLAELVNLEFLRRHVRAVHSGKERTLGGETRWVCRWGKCGKKEVKDEDGHEADFKGIEGSMVFESKEAFKEHIEEKHMIPMAWYMGDGPKVPDSEPKTITPQQLEPWLYTPSGAQITPSIKNQAIRGGKAKQYNAKRFAEHSNGIMVLVQSPKKSDLAAYVAVNDDDDDDEQQQGSEEEEEVGEGMEMDA